MNLTLSCPIKKTPWGEKTKKQKNLELITMFFLPDCLLPTLTFDTLKMTN